MRVAKKRRNIVPAPVIIPMIPLVYPSERLHPWRAPPFHLEVIVAPPFISLNFRSVRDMLAIGFR
jgi:hypothetical protein